MLHISKTKRKFGNLRGIANLPAIDLLRFGLLAAVFTATNNVNQVDSIECGTVNLYREAVLGGKEVVKDEWPFVAALYYSRSFKYFCGGTIISEKHVLTAAHCIQRKSNALQLSSDEITVRLGAYNLTDRNEKDVVDKSVTQIYVHPDWNVYVQRYDADIAILVLSSHLMFSNNIRPVCMPSADFLIDRLSGTVVGWGKTENGTTEGIPKKIEINVLNDTYCYETDKGIASYASERSFCGEGSGTPSAGDSGGGFFAIVGSGWVQLGTVSFVRPEGTGNSLNVAVYMKLTSFRDWIADKVEHSGSNISVATTTTYLNCTYGYSNGAIYSCWLYDLNIRQGSFVVKNVFGSHVARNDNEDVVMIKFRTGVLASLPSNFGLIFRNLKFLVVLVDTRHIFRSNFQNLGRLVAIRFSDSSIAEFDENSLWDLPNLRSFILKNSKLKLLHADTFGKNFKLRKVNISSNALKSLPRNLFQNNSLLQLVAFDDNSIETIDENIFETNALLRHVSFKGNRLSHLSKNLFRNNPKLVFIDFTNNHLNIIDEQSFKVNSKLIFLSLPENELEFLPTQLVRGLTTLNKFILNENAVKAIDEQFFETNVEIETIIMHHNQLTRIPANLFRNSFQLKFLFLADNFIETIDDELFEHNSLLGQVHLEFNFLIELPGNLFRHNSMLEYVYVDFNSIESIDEHTFEWNTRLREVHFSGNAVSFLPGKLFQNNSLLETVHFGLNHLEAIDEPTFQMNFNLQAVDLSSNSLSYIPENLFRNNPLLRIVNLSNNFFKTLNENIFSGNANLEKILLRQGTLQSLPRNLFRVNSLLQHINLSENVLNFIETNFTGLNHAVYINLFRNVCVDTFFYEGESYSYKSKTQIERIEKLREFQAVVAGSCS